MKKIKAYAVSEVTSLLNEPEVTYSSPLSTSGKGALEYPVISDEELKNSCMPLEESKRLLFDRQLRTFINANAVATLQDGAKPVSSKLRGMVSLSQDFDYKSEIQNRPSE